MIVGNPAQALFGSAAGPRASGGVPETGESFPRPALMGDVNVLSSVSTTLENGKTLSMFRFNLGGSGLQAQLAQSSGAPIMPSRDEQIANQAMYGSFKQLAGYFRHVLTDENTTLTGTAALDVKV